MYARIESVITTAEDCRERLPWIKEQARREVDSRGLTDFSKIEIKQREMEQRLLSASAIKAEQMVHLHLFTEPPLEAADLWENIDSPLVSDGRIDLVDVIYAVAVTPVNDIQPLTKGFIKNNTYWLGVQPKMDKRPENITEIKSNIAGRVIGILDQNIDVLTTRLKDSLVTAKQRALDSRAAASVTFLTLRIEPDHQPRKRNQGLKVAGHYECFQLTHDLDKPGEFILHEANSSRINEDTVSVDQIHTLENSDALQYVLQQAQAAGYHISTIKRKTVYWQAESMGCGFCALQTAIDASRSASSITDLPYRECSQASEQYPDLTLEGELRLTQAASLFNSSAHDVQYELMNAKANQYITLADDADNNRSPPSPEMLRKYLPLHQQNSEATAMAGSPAGNLRQSSATAGGMSVKAAQSYASAETPEISPALCLREDMGQILEPLYQEINGYCTRIWSEPEQSGFFAIFIKGYSKQAKLDAGGKLIYMVII